MIFRILVLLLLLVTSAAAHVVEEGATPEHAATHGFTLPLWVELAGGAITFLILGWFIKEYWS